MLSDFRFGTGLVDRVFPPDILESAARLVDALSTIHRKVATAESCTGGLLAGAITSIAGSSDVFDQGFITYANSAKVSMIGVDQAVVDRYGAVSMEVVRAMAEGALQDRGGRCGRVDHWHSRPQRRHG